MTKTKWVISCESADHNFNKNNLFKTCKYCGSLVYKGLLDLDEWNKYYYCGTIVYGKGNNYTFNKK